MRMYNTLLDRWGWLFEIHPPIGWGLVSVHAGPEAGQHAAGQVGLKFL